MSLCVRPATAEDLPQLAALYASARAFMRKNGNPNQWGETQPDLCRIRQDIADGQLFAVTEQGRLCGAFALVSGDDPTYCEIVGRWPSSRPYAALHRVVSDGSARGVFAAALSFAAARHSELRVDTHADNRPMQRAILRAGFRFCGVIHVADGSARLAYQRSDGQFPEKA